jgi:hypothetical protein
MRAMVNARQREEQVGVVLNTLVYQRFLGESLE